MIMIITFVDVMQWFQKGQKKAMMEALEKIKAG